MTKFLTPIANITPLSGGPDGQVVANYAKYFKSAVATAYHSIGGQTRFNEIAEEDPKWFYEKFITRMIPKEVEVGATQGIEDLLRQLDAGEHAQVIEGKVNGTDT
jgi:hypothetical protein